MLKSLVAHLDPKSIISESYRTLRTNIQFSNIDDNLHCILITSTGPAEGKSTTVANLAITIAQTGKRVLIVDTDLRRPTVHKKFGVSNTKGLTHLLSNQIEIAEVIQKTDVNNLFVLTSGPIPPNPSELLDSRRMMKLIEVLKGSFDMVILDSPPVLAVTDSQILATEVDGVILVVTYGKTDKKALVKAKENLDKVKAHIIGAVLTRVPEKSRGGYQYYYYYGKEEKA